MKLTKISIDKIKPAPYNPRIDIKDNPDFYEKLKNSIEKFGYVEPIIYNKRTGHIVGGNQRYQILKDKGIKEIEVVEIDLPEQDEKALNIALNKISGDWDFPKLNELILDLEEQDYDIELTGFDADELNDIFDDLKEAEEDDFDVEDAITEEPKSKYGDIYQLGRHRLMCGDATKEEDVKALMDGKKINLVVTSPPYFNAREYSQWDTFEEYLNDMSNIIKNTINYSSEKFLIVWNVSFIRDNNGAWDIPSHTSVLMKNMGLNFFERIIWKKSGGVFDCPRSMHIDKGHYFPAYSYEDILVYGKKHPPFDLKDKSKIKEWITDVWEFRQVKTNNPNNNEGHPAQFPIELPYRAILSYTQKDQIVLDPFGGSGTTLIAAEQLNRICYMMEIDPVYVDVIIKRWEELTGKHAEYLGNISQN